MKKQTIIDIAATLLLVMFLYTAFSKYFDWGSYKRGMNNQHLTKELTVLLIYSLPPVEIIAGILLILRGRGQPDS
jgi:TRAP-type mannitol/chloroaromatic compound transport system permease small subunit